eukprot:GHVT01038859.1.p1 GENE.GHVT01038859.1~~GHVT01038859.1.p1  ORF type:complete len:840 (+),score=141.57 GHVT01038859.1:93-2612(+)
MYYNKQKIIFMRLVLFHYPQETSRRSPKNRVQFIQWLSSTKDLGQLEGTALSMAAGETCAPPLEDCLDSPSASAEGTLAGSHGSANCHFTGVAVPLPSLGSVVILEVDAILRKRPNPPAGSSARALRPESSPAHLGTTMFDEAVCAMELCDDLRLFREPDSQIQQLRRAFVKYSLLQILRPADAAPLPLIVTDLRGPHAVLVDVVAGPRGLPIVSFALVVFYDFLQTLQASPANNRLTITAAHAALKRVREPSVGYCPSESGPAALSAEKAELSILPAVSDLDSVAAVPATAELDGLPAASTPRRRGRPPLNRGTSGLPSATKKRQARLSSAGSRKTPRIVDASSADTAKEILDTDATSKSDTEKTALADGKQLPDSIAGAASEASGAHHGSSDLDAQHTASKAADSERSENNVADSATEDPPTNSPAAKRKKIISNGKPKSTGSKVTEDSANDPTIANSTGQEASRLSVETGAQSKGDKDESENGGAEQQSKSKPTKSKLKQKIRTGGSTQELNSASSSASSSSSVSSASSVTSVTSTTPLKSNAEVVTSSDESDDECISSTTEIGTTTTSLLRPFPGTSEDSSSSDESTRSACPVAALATAASEPDSSPSNSSRSSSTSRDAFPSDRPSSPSQRPSSPLSSTPLKSPSSIAGAEAGSSAGRSLSKPVGLETATPSASPRSTSVKKKKSSNMDCRIKVVVAEDCPPLSPVSPATRSSGSKTTPSQSTPASPTVSTASDVPKKKEKAADNKEEAKALSALAPPGSDEGKKKKKHTLHTAAEKHRQSNELKEHRTLDEPKIDKPQGVGKTDGQISLSPVTRNASTPLKKKKKKIVSALAD